MDEVKVGQAAQTSTNPAQKVRRAGSSSNLEDLWGGETGGEMEKQRLAVFLSCKSWCHLTFAISESS